MATATFTGVTRLKTEGMRIGFQRLKKEAMAFKRDVAQPFAEAAGALGKFARRAAIAGAAIATLGTRQVFKLEGVEEQFTVLMGSTSKAKQRVKELIDLSARTPFDLGPYVEAARTLYAIGGDSLSGNNMLTMLGDTAASMGVDIQQAAIWTGKLYNSLKSGSGVGTSGDDMMRAGLMSADTYGRLIKMTRAGEGFGKIWPLVISDLSRFNGGMARLSKTGSGLLATFRGLISLGMAKLFQGFGESVKNVVFVMNRLMQNGGLDAFAKMGKTLGRATAQALNFVARIVAAYRNLDTNTRASFNSHLGVLAVVLVAWKSGFLAPMISGVINLTGFVIRNLGAISAGLSVFAAGIAGYQVGKSLFQAMSSKDQNTVEYLVASLEHMIIVVKSYITKMIEYARYGGVEFFKALANPKYKPDSDIGKLIEERASGRMQAENARYKKLIGELDEYNKLYTKNDSGTFGSRLGAALSENFSLDGFKKLLIDGLKSVAPADILKFLDEFRNVGDIRFPKMPKLQPLERQLKTGEVVANMEKIRRSAFTIRGFSFTKFGPAIEARLAAVRQKAAAQATPQNGNNGSVNLAPTNSLLNDIERNTRSRVAVFAK